MTVFITGATGFVGRHLLHYLLIRQPNLKLVCLVRDIAKARQQWPDSPPNLEWLEGDLLSPVTYQQRLAEAKLVFHVASLVSLRNGPEFYEQNTEATRQLLAALKQSSALQRLVMVGSIAAIDRPKDEPALKPLKDDSPAHPNTDYGKSKLQAEHLVMDSGLPYCILRPAFIYGPHPRLNSSMDRLMKDMIQGKAYTRFPFRGRVSEVYVEDLAEMLWISANHPKTLNDRFFISNPEPIAVAEAFESLAKALDKPLHRLNYSAVQIDRVRRRLYWRHPENLTLRILFESYFACDPCRWYAATGYKPRYGLTEGLARTVGWYRQNGIFTE